MSTATTTAAELTEGMLVILPGRKHAAEVESVMVGRYGIEIATSSVQGWAAHVLPADAIVRVAA